MLEELNPHYDCLVVGGGIVGAGIFRDLSLHGISTLLIDKKDFSSQTSKASSKMLHGGIRYLENFDFKLVYEALHEKNFWLKTTPHLCKEEAFHLPIFNNSKRPLWQIRIGLAAYDALSGFKNTKHRVLNKKETMKAIPGIKEDGLKGSGVYYDAIVDDRKMTLEVIFDGALEKNAKAVNHIGLINFKNLSNGMIEATLEDSLTKNSRVITCKELIFATGPFTDKVLSQYPQLNWKHRILPNKGSHLWIDPKALEIDLPMVLNTDDGRIIFVIPHHEKILVGTTEKMITGDFFDLAPDQDEVDYLIECLNTYFPNSNITEADILEKFAGVRPLVKEPGESDLSKTAREHKIFSIKENIHTIIGGKYTTFRVMAKHLVEQITPKFGKTYNEELCKGLLRKPCIVAPFEKVKITDEVIERIRAEEFVRTEEDLKNRL